MNKVLTFITIIFFSLLFYYALNTNVSHRVVEEGNIIHTNIFGGVVEVTEPIDTVSTPNYTTEEEWEDSLKRVGYYGNEEKGQ